MQDQSASRFHELVKNARQSLSEGDQADTWKYAELLLLEFPKSEEGWLVLASISEPEKALEYLENALRLNPDSQAARQAIRLITSRIINVNHTVAEIPEAQPLDDTQPILIREIPYIKVESVAGMDEIDEIVTDTATKETSLPEDNHPEKMETVESKGPDVEIFIETPLIEEFPEIHTEVSNQPALEEVNESSMQEPTPALITPTLEKKKRIKKKLVKPVDTSPAQSVKQSSGKSEKKELVKTTKNQNPQRKSFDVETVELFLIAGAALLLPVLVFLFFYLRR